MHRKNHPNEPKFAVIWRQLEGFNSFQKGFHFFGRWIALTEPEPKVADFIGHKFGAVERLPASEAAAIILEQTFGKQEDIFVSDSAPRACHTNWDGYARVIAYDPEKDRIIATTEVGITLPIQGSNVVEAAIWLPRQYEQLMKKAAKIEEGIKSLRTSIDQGTEYAYAASPLVIHVRVPNFRHLDPHNSAVFDQIAEDTINRALANIRAA